MVGDARLPLLLPLGTTKVAPDNTVVLTLKHGNQISPRLTQLIIVVHILLLYITLCSHCDVTSHLICKKTTTKSWITRQPRVLSQ